jgi:hypothetical protein
MQLSTLVLPAPFGPINANSSPDSMANDTWSRTTRPPKRSDRLLTLLHDEIRKAVEQSAMAGPQS